MPFNIVYGPISAALHLASQAGAGQGFQQAFQNQMQAEQSMHQGQAQDNSAIESGIQDSLAYDRLRSQDAENVMRNNATVSDQSARNLMSSQNLDLEKTKVKNEKSYRDETLTQNAGKQADLNQHRSDELDLKSRNLDLQGDNLSLRQQSAEHNDALHDAQAGKIQDYGEQYLNTSAGKLDMQRLKDLEEDKKAATAALTNALGERARTAASSSADGATKAYNEHFAALQARMNSFAQQAHEQSQSAMPTTKPATISGQPRIDPRQAQQAGSAVTGTQPAQSQNARPIPPTDQTPKTPQSGGTQPQFPPQVQVQGKVYQIPPDAPEVTIRGATYKKLGDGAIVSQTGRVFLVDPSGKVVSEIK